MRSVAVALVLLGAASRPAAADGVLIESHVGARPQDADYLLAPVREELATRGFVVSPPDLAARLTRQLGAPQVPIDADTKRRATDGTERGWSLWVNGEFELAATQLEEVLALLAPHPASVAEDDALKPLVVKALIGLAVASRRMQRNDRAAAAMAELARRFPRLEFNRAVYGPEPIQLYQAAVKQLEKQGAGTLAVTADAKMAIFIDDHYAGMGSVTESVLPGRHRVFGRLGDRYGFVHEVDVTPGDRSSVELDLLVDAHVRVGPDWVGLMFADDEQRQQLEARLAARIAASGRAAEVAVVRIGPHRGHRALLGQMVRAATAETVRAGALDVETRAPTAKRLRALASYLAGGERGDGVEDIATGPRRDKDRPAGPGRPLRKWKWIALGASLVAVGVGAYLISIDGRQGCDLEAPALECPTLLNSDGWGYGVIAGGAVLAGAGIYLWIKDKPADRGTRAAIVPVRGGATVGLAGSF